MPIAGTPRHAPVRALVSAASLALPLSFALAGATRAETLVDIPRYVLGELQSTGFEIPRKARVQIEAVGIRRPWDDDFVAYAWILDAATREVVWSQERARSARVDDERRLRRTAAEIDLEPGRYEMHAWAGWGRNDDVSLRFADVEDWARGAWHWEDRADGRDRDLRRMVRDCKISVASTELRATEVARFQPTGEISGWLFRAAGLGDGDHGRVGFRVERPMDLRIYALVESPRRWDGCADGAWIVDTATRERVWEIRRRDTRPAGGAAKNRLFDDEIELRPGQYTLYWGTDDSHSTEEWNADPPDDPLNWGVTLLPGKRFDATGFQLQGGENRPEPLAALTRVGDQEDVERAFRLARAADLQIYALGEYDEGGDEFADRSWIEAAGSGEIVWEMTDANCHPAGGAEKNRLFDGTVHLAPGEYILHYETDDSHAYDRWNAAAPFDPESWGVALYPGSGFDRHDFVPLEKAAAAVPKNVLVRLTEVGDDAALDEEFSLKKPTRVRIYALGEGVEGQMYDYGWIENKTTGEVVWEMTYRGTRHAGGARKNRKFDGELQLAPGTYVVRYESDDSHSWPDWNARRPKDARNWGITVSAAEAR
jgi:hypothetical protein